MHTKNLTLIRALYVQLCLVVLAMIVAIAGGSAICDPRLLVSAQAEEASSKPPLTVVVERTDKLSEPLHVGDRLTFTIKYTNNTDKKLTVIPCDTNLGGVKVEGSYGGCRWRDLKPGQTAECGFGYYDVKPEDVKNGVAITSLWKATTDRDGKIVVEGGENLGAAVPPTITNVVAEPRPPEPDAAVTPHTIAPSETIELARPGFMGFACHRIPALTQLPNGDILAAWDGRPNNCGDAPQENSLLQRRSTDGGKSWSMPTVIAAGKGGANKWGYSDPSYVVDRQTGEIFVFSVKSYDQGFWGSHAGTDPADRNVLHAVVTSSADGGHTYGTPRYITAEVSGFGDRSRFAASGEGIQIVHGPYAERLVQQFTTLVGNTFKAMSVYSDDHGVTWKHGEPVGTGMDENKVVELSDGRLMMNSRSSEGGQTVRKVAISEDGGQTWSEPKPEEQLIDPRNNASIIRAFPNADNNDPRAKILLFSNAKNRSGRSNGHISVSFDDGATWPLSRQFQPGEMAYSTLHPLDKAGTYGLLYEGAGHTINYTYVDLAWLGIADRIYKVENLELSTEYGVAPQLPESVTVTTLDESTKEAHVTWPAIEPAEYSKKEGSVFEVTGTVEGTDLVAKARITVAAEPIPEPKPEPKPQPEPKPNPQPQTEDKQTTTTKKVIRKKALPHVGVPGGFELIETALIAGGASALIVRRRFK